MEMEYINDNTMRVFIGAEDLAERGISLADLLENQGNVERFFMSILEEADVSNKFKHTDAVTFHVMPNHGGLDLYISKSTDNEEEDSESFREVVENVFSRANEPETNSDEHEETDATDKETQPEDNKERTHHHRSPHRHYSTARIRNHMIGDGAFHFVFEFEHLDDVIALSRAAHPADDADIQTYLYQAEGRYYLHAVLRRTSTTYDGAQNFAFFVAEFGQPSNLSPVMLEEHGKLLFERNALSQLHHIFN